MAVEIELKNGDVLRERADVLVLKFAQAAYGVDAQALDRLEASGRQIHLPAPWTFRFEDPVPGIAASRLLFMGVPPLREFSYSEIRAFARKALGAIAEEAPLTKHIALTIHGPGYGLDEIEAFEAEVAGLVDGVREDGNLKALRRISVVEYNSGRAERLASSLTALLPDHTITREAGLPVDRVGALAIDKLRAAGYRSGSKAHVFVAMPFRDEMDDVYHYGIQSAVKAAGFLCERADLSTFTGDVLEWVRSRIRSATLVVADLTDANPNVYLEVGYAWGIGVPTVFVVKSADQLKFDVRGQRCLVYKKIKELEDSLTAELRSLRGHGPGTEENIIRR
jgi:hypothetical protein